ncbi:MlaD family protein [Nocardia bovistercoris]|uniref:MCE family protein n=1 Tax=Nocardia bovistercoris TaxID=2785916 RepID=A0A931IJ67_9NOCA|nr:MlaD family protein [Nocardia bovistercoris]MBH0780655.1 MCE family protein [Nocardia bovistercoris]
MPLLNRNPLRRSRTRHARGPRPEAARDLRRGVIGLCCVVALLAAVAVIGTSAGTGEHTYTAEMSEAGFVRRGDDVRIAGIPVGKITALHLGDDRVRVEFSVAQDVFLGEQTTLSVRMLTVVGGYYLAVIPAGTKPLGSKPIAVDRVQLPYNLTRVFAEAVQPVRRIDAGAVRANLDALATAVNTSPTSVDALVDAVHALVGILDTQNTDISRTLATADEYLTALAANSEILGHLLDTFATLEAIVRTSKAQVGQALRDLATIVADLTPLGRTWDSTWKQQAGPLAEAIPQLQDLDTRLGELLDATQSFQRRLLPLAAPEGGIAIDQSATAIRTPGICIPIPAGAC